MQSKYIDRVIRNLWMQEASYTLKPTWVKDDSLDQRQLAASSSNELLVTERVGELEDGSKNILARVFLNRETQNLECFLLSDHVDVAYTLLTFKLTRERMLSDENGHAWIPSDVKQQDLLEGFGVSPPRIVVDFAEVDFDANEMHIAEYDETLISISTNLDTGVLELFTDVDLRDRNVLVFLFTVDKPEEGVFNTLINGTTQFQFHQDSIKHYKLAVYE